MCGSPIEGSPRSKAVHDSPSRVRLSGQAAERSVVSALAHAGRQDRPSASFHGLLQLHTHLVEREGAEVVRVLKVPDAIRDGVAPDVRRSRTRAFRGNQQPSLGPPHQPVGRTHEQLEAARRSRLDHWRRLLRHSAYTEAPRTELRGATPGHGCKADLWLRSLETGQTLD